MGIIVELAAVRSARLAAEVGRMEQFLELYGILKEGWRRARLAPPRTPTTEEEDPFDPQGWSGLEPLPA